MSNVDVAAAFAERLERLRAEARISKAEMARRSGLPSRTLENYFKGHMPSVQALVAISQGLSVDIDWLLGLKPIPGDYAGDLISDAVYRVASELAHKAIQKGKAGEAIVAGQTFLGLEVERFAGDMASRVREEYRRVRTLDVQAGRTARRQYYAEEG